jgi:hypothetical protein
MRRLPRVVVVLAVLVAAPGLRAAAPDQFRVWGSAGPEFPPVPAGWTQESAAPEGLPPLVPTPDEQRKGYVLFAHDPLSFADGDAVPAPSERARELRVFAARGEYEPLALAVHALEDPSASLRAGLREGSGHRTQARTSNIQRATSNVQRHEGPGFPLEVERWKLNVGRSDFLLLDTPHAGCAHEHLSPTTTMTIEAYLAGPGFVILCHAARSLAGRVRGGGDCCPAGGAGAWRRGAGSGASAGGGRFGVRSRSYRFSRHPRGTGQEKRQLRCRTP